MRETGPASKELTGDQDASVSTIGLARTQLGILKNQMKLGGLPAAARNITLEDGTTIRVSSIHSIDAIHIDTSQVVPQEEPEVEIPEPPVPIIPKVPEPRVTVPDVPTLAVWCGKFLNADVEAENTQFERPVRLNGATFDKPSQVPVKMPCTLYRNVQFRTDDPSFIVDSTILLIGVQYAGSALPANQQPTSWKVTANGIDLSSMVTSGATFLGTSPAGLAVLTIPALPIRDTLLRIEGNGPSGTIVGYLTLQKNVRFGASAGPIFGLVTINGYTAVNKDETVIVGVEVDGSVNAEFAGQWGSFPDFTAVLVVAIASGHADSTAWPIADGGATPGYVPVQFPSIGPAPCAEDMVGFGGNWSFGIVSSVPMNSGTFGSLGTITDIFGNVMNWSVVATASESIP